MTMQGPILISRFRGVEVLELKRVPLHMLEGLHRLRCQIRTVIVSRCLNNLQVRPQSNLNISKLLIYNYSCIMRWTLLFNDLIFTSYEGNNWFIIPKLLLKGVFIIFTFWCPFKAIWFHNVLFYCRQQNNLQYLK